MATYDLSIIFNKLLRPYQQEIIKPLIDGNKKHALLILPRRVGKSVMCMFLANSYVTNEYKAKGTKGRMNAGIYAMQDNQVRRIYIDNIMDNGWRLLDIATPIAKFIESRLELEYHFGNVKRGAISKIKFKGTTKLDALMGGGDKFIVLDEFALQPDGMTVYNRLFPMIMEKNGRMIIVSTVRGRNHMYELYNQLKDNPDWHVVKKDAIELGILTKEQYDAIPMNENLKKQEYLCDWDSSNEGAIYESPILGKPQFNPQYPLYIAMDLGMADGTVIWYGQYYDGKLFLLHSETHINKALPFIFNAIETKLKLISPTSFHIFLPHDAMHNEQITGTNRYQVFYNHFKRVSIVSKSNDILEDIEMVRNIWNNITFHEYNCMKEIEEIKQYTTHPDTYKVIHKHSHAPDGLRYLILGIKQYVDNNITTNVFQYERYYKL
jgi:hypothetical protein